MKYVVQETIEDGCIFCNRFASENDMHSLILRRTDHAFVIMNLFPYNTGHLMIVPNRHVADPGELTVDELNALGALLPQTLAALRNVFDPAGFNVGMNIGAFAGAGVADHLHQHVVPRWQGDANFMPILAGTMVLPELIPATYAKVRAEMERPLSTKRKHSVALVILSLDAGQVLVTNQQHLLKVDVDTPSALFGHAAQHLRSLGIDADLAGWAGNHSTKTPGRPAFAFLAAPVPEMASDVQWVSVHTAVDSLSREDDREALQSALALDLSIASAPPG